MKLNKFFRVKEYKTSWGYVYQEYIMKEGLFDTEGRNWRSQTNRANAYADHKKIIGRYMDEDCIVAYHQTTMGLVFLIKGKVKFFPFFWNQFSFGSSYNKNLMRMDNRDAIAYLEKYGTIVEQELWMKFCTLTTAEEI